MFELPGNADPRVPDDELHGTGLGADLGHDADLPALRCELDSVVQQAFENPGKGGGVAYDGKS